MAFRDVEYLCQKPCIIVIKWKGGNKNEALHLNATQETMLPKAVMGFLDRMIATKNCVT